MVWAADRATRDGDLASARRLIGMALAKLGATLAIQPAAGLLDAAVDSAVDETTSRAELLSDFAANGSVLAVAHGGLLSAIDLRNGYRLLRLASHSATIRQIKVSASGRYVATFADDQSLRLFSLPTGTQVLELALSLDFLALGERQHAELFAFTPDSRRLLALDCGERSGPACPLLRLQVFESERGSRRSEISLPAEPIEYTSRSDGTIAILPTGGTPRFFDAESGMEWPQPGPDDSTSSAASKPPASPDPAAGAARRTSGAAAGKGVSARQACFTKRLSSEGRPWLISPERHFALTLSSPALACLWDLVEHRLARPVALPKPLLQPRLLSLLSEAGLAVLAHRPQGPVQGDHPAARSVEIVRLGDALESGGASYVPFGRGHRSFPYPLSILPLDQGGAFWTAAPVHRVAHAAETTGAAMHEPDGTVCVLSAGQAVERGPSLRCFLAPTLWQQADARFGPLAVSGDGRFAFFGSMGPVVLDVKGRGTALAMRLPASPEPPRPSENAEILQDGRLVTLDVDGYLRVYALPAAEQTYSPSVPLALVALRQQGTELRMERKDGSQVLLALDSAALRRVDSPSLDARIAPSAGAQAAVLATPQAVLRIVGSAPGTLSLSERKPAGLRLWLQLLPDSAGDGARAERRSLAAVAVAKDGHFERIGEASLADIEPYVICRAGPYQVPLALCSERFEKKGLLSTALALLRGERGKETPSETTAR